MLSFENFLTEAAVELNEQFKIRVHANGQKQKKKVCPKGYKPSPDGKSCVPVAASERVTRRIANKRSGMKRHNDVAGQKRSSRRRKKAMKLRSMFGIKDGR